MLSGRRAPAFLLAALMIASPAWAQENQTAVPVVPDAPAPREDTVGPEQLRDFSLPGTPTRRAAPAEQPRIVPPPITTTERPQQAPTRQAAPSPATPQASAEPREASPPPPSAPATAATGTPPGSSLSLDLPPPTPAPDSGTAIPTGPSTLPVAPADDQGPSSPLQLWPWLLLAALAGIGGWLWLRRRRSETDEGGYGELAFAGPAPAPAPAPEPAPRPTPAPPPLRPAGERPPAPPPVRPAAELPPPPPAAPVGIVSSRLRPWLDLEFAPVRAVLSDSEALIEFEVSALNSGSVPARDVQIEAVILNASDEQEQELAAFFARGLAPGQGIEIIPPLGRVPLRSQVRLPRENIRDYLIEGRRLFVPLVAFTAAYRWSGGTGQTSASFLVGRGNPEAEKLGPLRLDQGPREWRDLGARLLPHGVRR